MTERMDVEEKWRRGRARLRAAAGEARAGARAIEGRAEGGRGESATEEEEEALQEVYDARVGAHTAALLRLMKVRAPDLRALAVKIELAIDQEVGTLTGGGLGLAALMRDVRRLMR